jgi:protoheme IX farnesyltransferase
MIEAAALNPVALGRLRDLAALGKPRLSFLVLFTAASGVWLAPAPPGLARTLGFLVATAALVAAANTLNCWLEREIDRLMHRTCDRPLPAGRLAPRTAVLFGSTLGVLALGAISATTNPLTVALGALALFSYVVVYTPLKRVTPWAVAVGAVPGALPPLMGWTAATGSLGAPGGFLFGILFLWQLPHFLAIALYLQDDFRRGGIRVLPLVHGDRVARLALCATMAGFVAFSILGPARGIGGWAYGATAAALGAAGLGLAAGGLRVEADATWARRIFAWSLVHLPVLVGALVLDPR